MAQTKRTGQIDQQTAASLLMIWRKQRQTLAATYESLQRLEEILELPPDKRTKRPE